MSQYLKQYEEKVEDANEAHLELKSLYCPRCGYELVKFSVNYSLGEHADGCPTEEVKGG